MALQVGGHCGNSCKLRVPGAQELLEERKQQTWEGKVSREGVLRTPMVSAGPDHPCVNRELEAWEGPTLGLQCTPDLCRNLRLFI